MNSANFYGKYCLTTPVCYVSGFLKVGEVLSVMWPYTEVCKTLFIK